MSLIFSNETRILFNNKKNADQLLELSYGNRVTRFKKTKVLSKFPNTSFNFRAKNFLHVRAQNLYKKKLVTNKYTYKASLCKCSTPIVNAVFPNTLTYGGRKGERGFAWPAAKLSDCTCKPMQFVQGEDKSQKHDKPLVVKNKSNVSLLNNVSKLNRKFSFNKPFFSKTNLTSHLQSLALQTRDVKDFFSQTLKCKGLQKPEEIKTLLPTIKVRDFAFGSSFLFIIMTTILQRQEQNAWCFQFLKRQTPGFSQFYQESSLECFENITNSYITRGNTKLKTPLNVSKNLDVKNATQIKNISFCKDDLYLDFAKPWTQQLNRDFASIFSKDVSKVLLYKKNYGQKSKPIEHRWMVPSFYKMHARIPNYFLVADQKSSIASSKRFSNFPINDRVFDESDTIPSKMSCSANRIFTDNYKLRIEKQNKNLEKRKNIERKNDVLKKFFYEYGFFSIPTQALQNKKTSSSVLDHEDFGKQPRKNQVDNELFSFAPMIGSKDIDLSLTAIDFEKLASIKNVNTPFSKNNVLSDQDHLFLCPKLQKQIGKISCYTFYNMFPKSNGSLCNRFLSGYKKAEVRLGTFCKSGTVFIRTGVKNVHRLNLPLQNLNNVMTFRQRVKIPLHLRAKTLAFYNNKLRLPMLYKSSCVGLSRKAWPSSSIYKEMTKERTRALAYKSSCKAKLMAMLCEAKQGQRTCKQSMDLSKANQIRAYKKLPYKKLSLSEYNEIKPLFEKINKEIRMSPHKVTFKKPLFIDYNDYLNRHKDSPAAIAISPSLEEDKAIDQSWDEYLERENLVNQSLDKSNLLSAAAYDENRVHGQEGDLGQGNQEQSLLVTQNEADLLQPTQEVDDYDFPSRSEHSGALPEATTFSNPEKLSNTTTSLDLENESLHDKSLNEEDKKREITKWEWLHNVRDSEASIEERKDLRKFAYPNKEALFTKRLKPKAGTIKNILVRDRKSSFFGITNIFPKRLIAKDQKQINDQILREDYDRRSVEIFESGDVPLFKFNSPVQTEQFLSCKSKLSPLKSYNAKEKPPTYVWKQGNYVQVTKGDPLYGELRPQEITTVRDSFAEKGAWGLTSTELRILPRQNNPTKSSAVVSHSGQHPIYRPSRRLRLRVADVSKENNNTQSRVDALNVYQSHRWWQKRRLDSSLLGAPSTRYMVIPEITKEDWKKIIEWQLKTYFLEEEKRLQPLILEKLNKVDRFSTASSLENGQKSELEQKDVLLVSKEKTFQETLHNFKIKKIAIYLPWITLKKNLNKPYEWPLTRLTYPSITDRKFLKTQKADAYWLSASTKPRLASLNGESNVLFPKNVFWNKKPYAFFTSAISPQFKARTLPLNDFHPLQSDGDEHTNIKKGYNLNEPLLTLNKERNSGASVYKPFLFEVVTKDSYLVIHQLLLAIAIKYIFQKIYHLFGKIVIDRVKNSSLEIALLRFAPFLFNPYSRENQAPGLYKLKKRLKDLIGSEDSISSLSEIVWYLRNSCRGRMIPRGVVLLESDNSESTEFLKAIGGEAQVPVIVQSLRALPFTQNHPQRRLEKILKFAEKQAPCILFLDDLDSIGKSRTALLNQNSEVCNGNVIGTNANRRGQRIGNPLLNRKDFSLGNEKSKWTNYKNAQRAYPCPCPKGMGMGFGFKSDSYKSPCVGGAIPKGQSNQIKDLYTGGDTKKQGVFNKRMSNFKLSVTLESPMDMQSLALQDNAKKAIQQSMPFGNAPGALPVPETEKIIEQRRLDLMLRLLTVMDGISHLKGVLIVTTSKNPSSLDPALLRPGRFEKFINLKLPNKKRRIDLLKLHTSKIGHSIPMPWEYLGTETQNMTGTAISDAINHSAVQAIIQSTPHTLSTLEYGLSRVNGNDFQRKRVPLARETQNLKAALKYSQTSFYNAGQSITESLFKQEKLVFHNYNTNVKGCVQNIIKSYTGHAAELLYLDSMPEQIFLQSEANGFQPTHLYPPSCSEGARTRGYKSKQVEFVSKAPRICIAPMKQSEALQGHHRRFGRQSFQLLNSRKKTSALGILSVNNYARNSTQKLMHIALSDKDQLEAAMLMSFIPKINSGFLGKDAPEQIFLQSEADGHTSARAPKKQEKGEKGYKSSCVDLSLARRAWACSSSSCKALLCTCKPTHLYPLPRALKKQKGRYESGVTNHRFDHLRYGHLLALPRKVEISAFKTKSRKYFQFNPVDNSTSSLLKQCLAFQGFERNKDSLFQSKTCARLQNFNRSAGHWYRLYLPKIERNKSNREWLIPDRFANQHVSLLDLNSIKARPDNSTTCKPKVIKSTICNPRALNIRKESLSLALKSFYVAFQNLNEHRELLDLLADHLIRFKFFRSHEILRISSFYVNTSL